MVGKTDIPPKTRPEWRSIVTGDSDHHFDNYVLKMKCFKASNQIKSGELSIDQAVEDLYNLASKYSRSVQRDFKIIFKEW